MISYPTLSVVLISETGRLERKKKLKKYINKTEQSTPLVSLVLSPLPTVFNTRTGGRCEGASWGRVGAAGWTPGKSLP